MHSSSLDADGAASQVGSGSAMAPVVSAVVKDVAKDVAVLVKQKYGLEHIRRHVAPSTHLSLLSKHACGSFRHLDDALRPKVQFSTALLEEIQDEATVSRMIALSGPDAVLESDVGGGFSEEVADHSGLGANFFQVRMQSPSSVKGQTSSSKADWQAGELVVTLLQILYADRQKQQMYLWSTPSDHTTDLKLLAPSSSIVDHMMTWSAAAEKYWWRASWGRSSRMPLALEAIKTLVDFGAVEGGASFNAQPVVHAQLLQGLNIMRHLGVVCCTSGHDDVTTSWQLKRDDFDLLESVTRLSDCRMMVTPSVDVPIKDMSHVDLLEVLFQRGWRHNWWPRKLKSLPAPYDRAAGGPLIWYTRGSGCNDETFAVSRSYLMALASADTLSSNDILHFKTDGYYKELMSGVEKPLSHGLLQLEGDVGMDMDPPAKRVKIVGGGAGVAFESGGGICDKPAKKRAQKHSKVNSDKTFTWGPCLITHSTNKKGVQCYEAKCHRLVAHKNLGGKQRTTCRKRIDITAAMPEEHVLRRLKTWVAQASDYTSRLRHQRWKCTLDEALDDEQLEMLKPRDDYRSDEDGVAVAKVVRGRGRGKTARGRGRGAASSKDAAPLSSSSGSSSSSESLLPARSSSGSSHSSSSTSS